MGETKARRVYVAGHRGLVGSAIVRALEKRKAADERLEIITRTRQETDLTDRTAVRAFFKESEPTQVILAAAKVGGIKANRDAPVDFLLENLKIQDNVLEAAHDHGVQKLLFLGSSCIYPKHAPQPIREDSLLTGPLEPTNEWYAIAKIAGIKMCQAYRRQYGCDYISAMPTNLYGPGDNYDLTSSHVVAALIAKAHAARRAGQNGLEVWGSGKPLREFMYVDDVADALVFLMENYSGEEHVNIGVGYDVTIRELAEIVAEIVGLN